MGNNIGGCPACEKCPERPCYPQTTVYILFGISVVSFIILLIAIAFGCYRLGRFRGHKRGVKNGEDLERHRRVEAENVANNRLASVLALTFARGNREQGSGTEIEERLVGGGVSGGAIDGKIGQPAGMLLFDGSPQSPQTPQQQRPFHGIQQQQQIVPHQQQGTPQSRLQHQIENPLAQLGFQYQSVNRSSKRFNNSSNEGTFII